MKREITLQISSPPDSPKAHLSQQPLSAPFFLYPSSPLLSQNPWLGIVGVTPYFFLIFELFSAPI